MGLKIWPFGDGAFKDNSLIEFPNRIITLKKDMIKTGKRRE
jgi:hypothetical protein